jgi:hypothetical protein
MKKIIPAIFIISLLLLVHRAESSISAATGGGNGHDSLLFDGADNFSPGNSVNTAVKCPILVKYISGIGEGTIVHSKEIMICNQSDSLVTTEKGVIKKDDVLNVGDEITTGPGSFMQIEFPDGSEMRLGPNSRVLIDQSWCQSYGVTDFAGDIWIHMKKILGSAKYEVKTDRCAVGNRGTIYTINTRHENGDTTVTVKVYEGSVEIMMNQMDMSQTVDTGLKIEQLGKDFQSGKITQDEYLKKMKENTEQITNNGESTQKTKTTITAGNMCTASLKLGEVLPIGNDEKWFETNFPNK